MNSNFQGYEKANMPVRQNSLQNYKQIEESFEEDFPTTNKQHQNNHADLSSDNEFSVKSEEQDEDEAEQSKESLEQEEEEFDSQEESQHEMKDYCEVCYSSVSDKFLQAGLERIFRLMYCKGCNTSAHLVCYGLSTFTEEKKAHNDEVITYFTCDRCREKNVKNELNCYVCGLGEGCLRVTSDKKWIHPVCGITNSNICYKDVAIMEIDLSSFRKESHKISNAKKCDICKTKVETLKCVNKGINKYCHLHCALRAALLSSQKKTWEVNFKIQTNEKFSLNQHIDESAIMANIEDIALCLKDSYQSQKDYENNDILKALKVKKGKGKASKGKRRVNREDPCISGFLNEVLDDTKACGNELLKEKISLKESSEEESGHIGGEISLIFVNGEAQTSMEVEDQGLDEDFVGILETLLKEFCDQDMILQPNEHQNQVKSHLQIVPNMNKASFPEVLFFANVLQKRTETVIKNVCCLQGISSLFESLKKIPFPLTGIMRALAGKIYTGAAVDVLLRKSIMTCQPVSAYDVIKKQFDKELIQKNFNSLKQADQLQMIYLKDYCGMKTQTYERILAYLKQLSFLDEFYQIMGDHHQDQKGTITPTKKLVPSKNISVNAITTLIQKATEVGLNTSLGEIKLLQESAPSGSANALLSLNKDQMHDSNNNSLVVSNSDTLGGNSSLRGSRIEYSSDKQSLTKSSAAKSSNSRNSSKTPLKALTQRGRGRPPSTDKIINEIEEDYQRQVQELNGKIDIKDAEKKVEHARVMGAGNGGLKLLEEGIEKVQEWEMKYKQLVEENNGNLKQLIDDLQKLDIKIPEMFEALNHQKNWWIWKNRIVVMRRKLRKRRDNIYEKDGEVTLEELEEIVREGDCNIFHLESEDEDFEEIKDKLNRIKEIQEALNSFDISWKLFDLQSVERELKGINVKLFPEVNNLKSKIETNLQIQELIQEEINSEELNRRVEEFGRLIDSVDEELIDQLRDKGLDENLISVKRRIDLSKELESENIEEKFESRLEEEEGALGFEEEQGELEDRDNEEEDSIKTWKKEVKALLGVNPEETIFRLLQHSDSKDYDCNQLKQELEGFKRRCSRLANVNLDEVEDSLVEQEKSKVCKMVLWLSWIVQALNMKQQVDEDQEPLSYAQIKLAVERMVEIKLREDIGLCKHMKMWYEKAEKVRKEFDKSYGQIRENFRRVMENESFKGNGDKLKVDITEAQRILDMLRSVGEFVSLEQEVEIINEDMKSLEDWANSVQGLCEKYGGLLEISGHHEDTLKVKKDIIMEKVGGLKMETARIFIRSKEQERELRIFDWAFNVILVIKKLKKIEQDTIKRLLKEGDQLLSEEPHNSELKALRDCLKKEALAIEKNKSFLEDIKKLEEDHNLPKLAYESLLKAMSETKGKKGGSQEESKVLEDLYLRFEALRDSARSVLQTGQQKKPISEFTKVLDQIKKFPISLKEERQQLEESIELANKVVAELKKSLFGDYEEMERIVQKYKKCPIFIKKADEIEKKYEGIRASYEKVKTEGKKIALGECKLSFEELGDLLQKIDMVQQYRYEEGFKKLKKDVLVKRCEILKRQGGKAREESSIIVSYKTLKEMSMEVYELKNEFRKDSKLDEVREFLEAQLQKAEEILNEIKKARSVETLEKYANGKTLVDFSKEIAERKTALRDNPPIQHSQQRQSQSQSQSQNMHSQMEKEDMNKDMAIKKKVGKPIRKEENEVVKGKERMESRDSRENSRMSREDDRDHEKKRELLRKRGSPPREKPKEKEKDNKDKDKEKERERDREKERVKEKEKFVIKGKRTTETKNAVKQTLKKIIESNRALNIKQMEAFEYVNLIVQAYPEVMKSGDALVRVADGLKNLMRFRYIAQSLVSKWFEAAYLKSLMVKDLDGLMQFESNLKAKALKEAETQKEKDRGDNVPDKEVTIKKKSKNNSQTDLTRILPLPKPETSKPDNEKPMWSSLKHQRDRGQETQQKNPFWNMLKKAENPAVREIPDNRSDSLGSERFSQNGEDSPHLLDDNNGKKSLPKVLAPGGGPVPVKRTQEVILYDPDNPTENKDSLEMMMPYDPEEEGSRRQGRSIGDMIMDLGPVPEGAILKIFEGVLMSGNDRTCPKAALFTCNSFELVNSIPQLVEDKHVALKISGRTSFDKFRAYLNRALNAGEKSANKMISGWIESHLSVYQNTCDQISKDFLDGNKVGMIEYNESSKIFFLHKSQFPVEWRAQLGLDVKRTQKSYTPSLYFIIYYQPEKLVKRVKSIAPEVVYSLDNDDVKRSIELKAIKTPRDAWNPPIENVGDVSPALTQDLVDYDFEEDTVMMGTREEVWGENTTLTSSPAMEKEREYNHYSHRVFNPPSSNAFYKEKMNNRGNMEEDRAKGFPGRDNKEEAQPLNRKRLFEELEPTHHPNPPPYSPPQSQPQPPQMSRQSDSSSSLMSFKDPRKKLKGSNFEKVIPQKSDVPEKEMMINGVSIDSILKLEGDELLNKLLSMENSQIAAFARLLDQPTRIRIMTCLQKIEARRATENNSEQEGTKQTEKMVTENNDNEDSILNKSLAQIQEESMERKDPSSIRVPTKMSPFLDENSMHDTPNFSREEEKVPHYVAPPTTPPFAYSRPDHSTRHQERSSFASPSYYNPPDFILKFYNLFSAEQLEEAKRKLNSAELRPPEPRLPKMLQQRNSAMNSANSSVIKQNFGMFRSNNLNTSFELNTSLREIPKDILTQEKPFPSRTMSQEIVIESEPVIEDFTPMEEEPTKTPLENSLVIQTSEVIEVQSPSSINLTSNMDNLNPLQPVSPTGFETPINKSKNLDEEEGRTDGKQSTPDWPRTPIDLKESTLGPEITSLHIPFNVTTEFSQSARSDGSAYVSFTAESNPSSFGDDVYVPTADGKMANTEEMLLDNITVIPKPEGKSTVDTEANKMSVESSTNKEENNAPPSLPRGMSLTSLNNVSSLRTENKEAAPVQPPVLPITTNTVPTPSRTLNAAIPSAFVSSFEQNKTDSTLLKMNNFASAAFNKTPQRDVSNAPTPNRDTTNNNNPISLNSSMVFETPITPNKMSSDNDLNNSRFASPPEKNNLQAASKVVNNPEASSLSPSVAKTNNSLLKGVVIKGNSLTLPKNLLDKLTALQNPEALKILMQLQSGKQGQTQNQNTTSIPQDENKTGGQIERPNQNKGDVMQGKPIENPLNQQLQHLGQNSQQQQQAPKPAFSLQNLQQLAMLALKIQNNKKAAENKPLQ